MRKTFAFYTCYLLEFENNVFAFISLSKGDILLAFCWYFLKTGILLVLRLFVLSHTFMFPFSNFSLY